MIFSFLFELLDIKEWLIFILAFLVFIQIIWNRNPANFPPGPLGLPFLGNVFTGVDYKTMNKVRKFWRSCWTTENDILKRWVSMGIANLKIKVELYRICICNCIEKNNSYVCMVKIRSKSLHTYTTEHTLHT